MATVTGVAGTSINAQLTVEDPGAVVRQNDDVVSLQSVCNDLATIKSGAHHFAGVKTFDDPVTISDILTCGSNVHIAQTHTLYADGSGCTLAGTWGISGAVTLGASCVLASISGARLNMVDGTTIDIQGRTRIAPPVDLSDAAHVLWDSVTSKRNSVRMLTGPAANRILTLPQPATWATSTGYTNAVSVVKTASGNMYLCSQTGTSASSGAGPSTTGTAIVDGSAKWDFVGVAPIDGDWFEVIVMLGTSGFTVGLQRAGSADYVAVIGDGLPSIFGSSNLAGSAKVRFNGTVWRLLSVGGVAFYGGDA